MNTLPYAFMIFGAIISVIGVVWLSRNDGVALDKAKSELINKDKFIISTIIGEGSYCYFVVSSISDKKTAILSVIPKGKFLMYDVYARIIDLNKFEDIGKRLSTDNLNECEKQFNLGNIIPEDGRPLLTIGADEKRGIRYNIFISARSGFFIELYRKVFVNNSWVKAYRLSKIEGTQEQIILDYKDKDYPQELINNDRDWHNFPKVGQRMVVQ